MLCIPFWLRNFFSFAPGVLFYYLSMFLVRIFLNLDCCTNRNVKSNQIQRIRALPVESGHRPLGWIQSLLKTRGAFKQASTVAFGAGSNSSHSLTEQLFENGQTLEDYRPLGVYPTVCKIVCHTAPLFRSYHPFHRWPQNCSGSWLALSPGTVA